ncbi:MAG: hypothetical protein ACJA1U_000143 [Bermanella sp.]|jgi:hypothetical protein
MDASTHSKAFRGTLRSPIARLIERGDIVEVVKGTLVITAKSGRPVPSDWLKLNTEALLTDIAGITGRNAFIYHGYSLGQYGAHKHDTLTLQFTNLNDMNDAFAAFNVSLKRQRAGRNNEPKGSPLPKGEFSPPKAGEFVKLWQRTGLKSYNPSRLCRYMGNLKGFVYTAAYSTTSKAKKKLANKSIGLLHVTYDELVAAMPTGCLNLAQEMPNSCLSPMPKEYSYSQVKQGLQEYSVTGACDHGSRLQGSAVNHSIGIAKRDLDRNHSDSVNNWLDEYESSGGLSPF